MLAPDISVVVPVYNTEAYLKKCIESIINQTFRNIEIILVDDGSTDTSAEILSDYASMDNRITVIHQENQGLSAARNAGIQSAKGEYIMFVDSDDWIDANTCEKAIDTARTFSADIVIWTYVREYPSGNRITELFDMKSITWSGEKKNAVFCQLVGPHGVRITHPERIDNLSVVWNKLYKKDKTIREKFVDTKLIGTEDFLFNIYAFYYADVVTFIPEVLYHYRYGNPHSLTRGYPKDFKRKWVNLFERVSDFVEQYAPTDDFRVALRNRICLSYIGLSMRVVSASDLTKKEKKKELQAIRELPTYDRAFDGWKLRRFPIHWRAYFFLVKYRLYSLLYCLCKIMYMMRCKRMLMINA